MPTRISFTVPEEDDHILLTTHEAVIEMDLMGYDIHKEHVPADSIELDLDRCTKPPEGWACTRAAGHDGPCAAIEEGEPPRQEIVLVAECQIHGLHGERDSCFVCNGPVNQVALQRVVD